MGRILARDFSTNSAKTAESEREAVTACEDQTVLLHCHRLSILQKGIEKVVVAASLSRSKTEKTANHKMITLTRTGNLAHGEA